VQVHPHPVSSPRCCFRQVEVLTPTARRSPIPVDLQVRAGKRLPEPVEVSAYYVVAEALTNAAKHSGASEVSVEVAGDVLRVAVRDDGAGGAGLSRGTGLAGLKDRVEALGGRIFLDSRPGGRDQPAGGVPAHRHERRRHLPLARARDGPQ
jgi:signal transduction histidine kinase